jgi:hypothetical protein
MFIFSIFFFSIFFFFFLIGCFGNEIGFVFNRFRFSLFWIWNWLRFRLYVFVDILFTLRRFS